MRISTDSRAVPYAMRRSQPGASSPPMFVAPQYSLQPGFTPATDGFALFHVPADSLEITPHICIRHHNVLHKFNKISILLHAMCSGTLSTVHTPGLMLDCAKI